MHHVKGCVQLSCDISSRIWSGVSNDIRSNTICKFNYFHYFLYFRLFSSKSTVISFLGFLNMIFFSLLLKNFSWSFCWQLVTCMRTCAIWRTLTRYYSQLCKPLMWVMFFKLLYINLWEMWKKCHDNFLEVFNN